jgi:hypothetical protein
MDATVHEITYSFEGLDAPFNSLLLLLQGRLREANSRGTRDAVVRRARTVVLVDNEVSRAQSLGNFLRAAGYGVVLAASTLDAFTLYLQGHYIPFALIMGNDDKANYLFLQRLMQQVQQKHNWDLLLVRFQFVQKTASPGLPSSSTNWPVRSTEGLPRTSPVNSDALPYISNISPKIQPNSPSSTSLSISPKFPSERKMVVSQVPRTPRQNTLLPLPAPALAPPEQYQNELAQQSTQPLYEPVRREKEPVDKIGTEKRTGEYDHYEEAVSASLTGIEVGEPQAQQMIGQSNLKKRVTLSGQKMGRFQVGMRLGAGPSSDVYQVYDLLREQESTMKAVQVDAVPFYMMDKSLEDITIFQREAELLNLIPHEGVVPLLNCGKSYTSGSPFVYKNMPLYSEGSLRSWLQRDRRSGAFVLNDILPLLMQIGEVLQYAHDHRVLHLNLKFSNILVTNKTKDIGRLRVALSDFSFVQDGSFFPGTRDLLYAAPENWEGTVDETSDQYGLAAITYELLTGRPPFQGTSERVMRILHQTKQPQLPTSLNPRLESSVNGVLVKALAKKPKDRYLSIKMFLAALQHQR